MANQSIWGYYEEIVTDVLFEHIWWRTRVTLSSRLPSIASIALECMWADVAVFMLLLLLYESNNVFSLIFVYVCLVNFFLVNAVGTTYNRRKNCQWWNKHVPSLTAILVTFSGLHGGNREMIKISKYCHQSTVSVVVWHYSHFI
jgi:hypothetical protein